MHRRSSLFAIAAVALASAACQTDLPTANTGTELPSADFDRRGGDPNYGIVYVVHGINGTDLGLDEALPVDVSVNGACALTDFRFRDIAGPLRLAAGSYDIQVHLAADAACTGAVAIDAPGIQLPGGANVSIAAHLTDGGAPTASVFVNDISADVHHGLAGLSARHTANFGLVDILVNGGEVFGDVANGQSGTAFVPRGVYNVAIAVADTDILAFEADLTLRPATFYAAYAVGTPANGTFEVILQTIRTRHHRGRK